MGNIRDEIKDKLLAEIKASTRPVDRSELIHQFERFVRTLQTEAQTAILKDK